MSMSWSTNRKRIYVFSLLILAIVVIGIPSFFIFYKAPTCSDGIQNGDEIGVDCGGSCPRLCSNLFLAPNVAWTRFQQVADGLYNVSAYIVNPNIDVTAIKVPYHIALYDDRGILISDTNSTVTIPPHRNTLAFIGAVSVGKRIPAKAAFEFTALPEWYRQADPLSAIQVTDKKYSEDELGSILSVTLSNNSVYGLSNVVVYVVLYDKDGNSLGFSRTVVDSIPGKSSVVAPFTWPVSYGGKVISIEVLPVME